jgi:hypothetical protein
MQEGKVSSNHDLLSVMLSTHDDQDQLATNEDINDNILLFLFAGHDTSSGTLAGVLKYLFLNPQCLQQVIKGRLMLHYSSDISVDLVMQLYTPIDNGLQFYIFIPLSFYNHNECLIFFEGLQSSCIIYRAKGDSNGEGSWVITKLG